MLATGTSRCPGFLQACPEPGADKVLRTDCMVKHGQTPTVLSDPARPGDPELSAVYVSSMTRMPAAKFTWHVSLHRRRCLSGAGINASQASQTCLSKRGAAGLLRLIFDAQRASVVVSNVIVMDETAVRVGRDRPGRMQRGFIQHHLSRKSPIRHADRQGHLGAGQGRGGPPLTAKAPGRSAPPHAD